MDWLYANIQWVFSGVGVFVLALIITFVMRRRSRTPRQTAINVGRNSYQAGNNVFVNSPQYNYIQQHYIFPNVIGSEWYYHTVPRDVLEDQYPELRILPKGLANDRLGFLLASSEGGNYQVDQLYLKLNAYAPCHLRDEYVEVLAFMGSVSYALYISEAFDVYPLLPFTDDLTRASWRYQDNDFDEFTILLHYPAYVLYLITINVDYLDLRSNEKKHIQSDEFALIRVERGNMGGCLEIERWFRDELRREPEHRSYDDGIPLDVYQLLTVDLDYNPGMLNVFLKNQSLAVRCSEIETIVGNRNENPVFRQNYESFKSALGDTGDHS